LHYTLKNEILQTIPNTLKKLEKEKKIAGWNTIKIILKK